MYIMQCNVMNEPCHYSVDTLSSGSDSAGPFHYGHCDSGVAIYHLAIKTSNCCQSGDYILFCSILLPNHI